MIERLVAIALVSLLSLCWLLAFGIVAWLSGEWLLLPLLAIPMIALSAIWISTAISPPGRTRLSA